MALAGSSKAIIVPFMEVEYSLNLSGRPQNTVKLSGFGVLREFGDEVISLSLDSGGKPFTINFGTSNLVSTSNMLYASCDQEVK